jgi:hypothetical protein
LELGLITIFEARQDVIVRHGERESIRKISKTSDRPKEGDRTDVAGFGVIVPSITAVPTRHFAPYVEWRRHAGGGRFWRVGWKKGLGAIRL